MNFSTGCTPTEIRIENQVKIAKIAIAPYYNSDRLAALAFLTNKDWRLAPIETIDKLNKPSPDHQAPSKSERWILCYRIRQQAPATNVVEIPHRILTESSQATPVQAIEACTALLAIITVAIPPNLGEVIEF